MIMWIMITSNKNPNNYKIELTAHYLQPARALVLVPRQQMLVRAAVPRCRPRRPACVCVSSSDSGLPCWCLVVWRRTTLGARPGRKQKKKRGKSRKPM